jgi:hypothetical protein
MAGIVIAEVLGEKSLLEPKLSQQGSRDKGQAK